MTEVVPKTFPVTRRTDKILPIYVWQTRPEILVIAVYDHVKNRKLNLPSAKALNTQIMYEITRFRWETGRDLALNRLYSGVGIFDKNGKLKTIKTKNHVVHYVL